MGIKDNFQQALRELTGTDKEEKDIKQDRSVDVMKSAINTTDTSEFDAIKEIDRRAAAAASEYDRQQRAFTGEPEKPEEPYGQDVSYNAQTGSFLGVNDSDSPLSMGQIPYGENSTNTESLSFDNAETSQNTGYQQNSGYQEEAAPQNTGYHQSYGSQTQQPSYSQQSYGGQSQQPSYSQQSYGGQSQQRYGGSQSSGGYQQNTAQNYQQSAASDRGNYIPGNAGGNPAADQQKIFSAARYQQTQSDDDEITVISRNTVIDGNIRSFANMSVDGNVKGNIETTKDIDLNGKIVGNIACNNAQMRTSQIQGNIQMKGNAYMERDTLLIGDLTSTYANVNGKIKGNLDITGKAELKSDAVVFGDISASTITVNDGAIIQGYVSTTFLNKEESKNIFPDTITIGE